MPSELERLWRIGDDKWNNDDFDVTNAGTTCTLYFKDSGTDSANDTTKIYKRYFGLGRNANHINIRPSGVITITAVKVAGKLVTFKAPIVVQTTGYVRNFAANMEYMVIVTQAASENIKCEVN